MSSRSGLLKAEKRRRPHTSMYEMVVNLYKSFVCSGTEGRDNKAHWLCADSANCWQEKKKKEKKERKKSSQSIPEMRNTDRSRSHFSPKSGRLWKAQTSPWAKQVNIISWMHVFFSAMLISIHYLLKKVFGAVSLLWCIPKSSLIISRFNCFSPCLLFCAGNRRTSLTVVVEPSGSKASVLSHWTCSSN